MNTTPVDIAKSASDFRLYLRNNIYPMNQQLIQDNIYTTIPDTIDMTYQPNMLEYCIKCTNKKTSPVNYDMHIEDAIINILKNTFNTIIMNDRTLTDDTKSLYRIIYNNIVNLNHQSWYLKMLYNVCFFQCNATSRLVIVTL